MIWIDVDTAVEMIVNKVPLVASADGYTIDETIAYNESGMDLNWNFVATAGVVSQTNVTPTTSGDYDWAHVGNGIYKIEMTASGGASANNDTEGFGWWSGVADAIVPFTSPVYGFRAAAINNSLVDGTDNLEVDLLQIGGVAQSATDLKDFADTGYDPTAHKVQGVVLADGCTANSDMRGTDSAALASVVGALNDVAAAGDPTDADTVVKYIKQLINVLIGTDGVAAFPAASDPANSVSLAEVIRSIHVLATAIPTTMRGTDNAALATDLATVAGYLDTEIAAIKAVTDVIPDAGALTTIDGNITTIDTVVDAIKAKTDNLPSGIPKGVELANFPFLMVDETDLSHKAGLTVTAQIKKDGGSFASCTNSVSESSLGIYEITLTATEMNADTLCLIFTATGAKDRAISIKTDA